MYSLQFPANSTDFSEDLLQLENREDHSLGLDECFQRLLTEETSRYVFSGFQVYNLGQDMQSIPMWLTLHPLIRFLGYM